MAGLVLGKEALRIYDGLRRKDNESLNELGEKLDKSGYSLINDYTLNRRIGRAGLNPMDYGRISVKEGEENSYVAIGLNPMKRVHVIKGHYRDGEFVNILERDARVNPESVFDSTDPKFFPMRMGGGVAGYLLASSIKPDDDFLKLLSGFTGIILTHMIIRGLGVVVKEYLRLSEGVEYGRRAVRSALIEAEIA